MSFIDHTVVGLIVPLCELHVRFAFLFAFRNWNRKWNISLAVFLFCILGQNIANRIHAVQVMTDVISMVVMCVFPRKLNKHLSPTAQRGILGHTIICKVPNAKTIAFAWKNNISSASDHFISTTSSYPRLFVGQLVFFFRICRSCFPPSKCSGIL